MNLPFRLLRAGAPLALLVPAARAQSIHTIVQTGDVIPGVGNVVLVRGVAVDDAGHALVHVQTDYPDLDLDAALVDENGAVVMVEGEVMNAPPGAVVTSLNHGEHKLSGPGTGAFLLALDDSSGNSLGKGVYWGGGPIPNLAVLEGDPVTAPEVSSGWSYGLFLTPYINGHDVLCFHSVLDDPNVSGQYDTRALVTLDTATGTQRVVAKDGDLLPGQQYPVMEMQWGYTAINDAGQVMYLVQTWDAIQVQMVLYLDDTIIAQKGHPSPWGPVYGNFGTGESADLNNLGDYAFINQLSTFQYSGGIVLNGEAWLKEGETLPDIEPFKISDMGQGLRLGDNGSILWMGKWDVPGPTDAVGLFVDYNLIVEQGVTEIGGLVVEELFPHDTGYELSASGQYLIFRAKLEGGLEGGFLIDLWQ